MRTSGTSDTTHDLKLATLKESLIKECRVMVAHAMDNGKPLDIKQIEPLEKSDDQVTSRELLPVYNYLLLLVKPAKPGTLILFEKNRQSKNIFKFLGPLPIIRRFMLLAIISLLALIAFSLSKDVNATSIELSMLQGYGTDQALRLGFLISAASVGASFYALFRMNYFINQGTFDVKYSSTYWARYVVGIVAGVLLSELFIVFINPETEVTVNEHIGADAGLSESGLINTTRYLLKPILAILGGFSANLVYRILTRLVEAIESLFKGSSEEELNRQQVELMAQSQEALNQVKTATANQVLSVKNELLSNGVAPDMLARLDDLTGSLVPEMAVVKSADKDDSPTTEAITETQVSVEEVTEPSPESEVNTDLDTTELVNEEIEDKEDKDNVAPTASW